MEHEVQVDIGGIIDTAMALCSWCNLTARSRRGGGA